MRISPATKHRHDPAKRAPRLRLFDALAEQPAEAAAEPVVVEEPAEPEVPPQPDIPHHESLPAETSGPETSYDVTPPVDSSDSEVPQQTVTPEIEVQPHEPSPYVEAVADEPAAAPVAQPASAPVAESPPPPAVEISAPAPTVKAPSWLDEPLPNTRRLPLRFMWQMDHESRFSLGSDEFTRLIGARTAAGFGRLWSDIAAAFGLDPDGRVVKAFATRDTWSGITLNWPVDGGGRLPVELSGLPIFDRTRNFAGYRGFGVCRDLDGLARLAALRRYEFFGAPLAPQPLSADVVQAGPASDAPGEDLPSEDLPSKDAAAHDVPTQELSAEYLLAEDALQEALPEEALPPENLTAEHPPIADVPSEPGAASAPPAELPEPKRIRDFTPNRFGNARGNPRGNASGNAEERFAVPPARRRQTAVADAGRKQRLQRTRAAIVGAARDRDGRGHDAARDRASSRDRRPKRTTSANEPNSEPPAGEQPEWLAPPEPPARGEARRDKALLDLLPVGILIYRLDRLLYANPAFLDADGLCRACMRWRTPAASTRSMSSPACRMPPVRRTPARR